MGLRVYTGGTFDLFHVGHLNLLKRCREIAGPNGQVTVSLNTDEFIAKYKTKPPIIEYADRAEMLKACRYVDLVIPNIGGADSKPAILEAAPDVIAIGSDWAQRDYHKQMSFTQLWLDQQNISLMYVPYTERISSTLIKAKM
jgi:glycerol-3-phosphate cytidylyltransferase